MGCSQTQKLLEMSKQDKFTAQSSEPFNSVWITATKTRKNRKPRAKFMISRNRTIIS